MKWRRLLTVVPMLAMTGCDLRPVEGEPPLEPLPPAAAQEGIAASRVNGPVGTFAGTPAALTSTAAFESLRQPPPGSSVSLGQITLDFADSDIREVAAQILGNILHVNFTIDPAVKGTATLHTATPMTRAQLVATLQSLLAANNATMIETAGFYRVVPAAGGAGSLGTSDGSSAAVPLRYASAVELAKVLQPFLQAGGRIAADPGSNAMIVVGDPATREALIGLIRAFDVDTLAGQSYALFPVSSGDAQGTAAALQVAFRSQGGGALANLVRVVPMQAINSVLVIASQPSYIEDARRVFTLIERGRRQSRAQLARLLSAEQPQQRRGLRAAAGLHAGPRDRGPDADRQPCPRIQPSRLNSGGGRRWRRRRRRRAAAACRAPARAAAGITRQSPATSAGGATATQPGADNQDQAAAAAGNPLAGRPRRGARPDRHVGLYDRPCASFRTIRTTPF